MLTKTEIKKAFEEVQEAVLEPKIVLALKSFDRLSSFKNNEFVEKIVNDVISTELRISNKQKVQETVKFFYFKVKDRESGKIRTVKEKYQITISADSINSEERFKQTVKGEFVAVLENSIKGNSTKSSLWKSIAELLGVPLESHLSELAIRSRIV